MSHEEDLQLQPATELDKETQNLMRIASTQQLVLGGLVRAQIALANASVTDSTDNVQLREMLELIHYMKESIDAVLGALFQTVQASMTAGESDGELSN